MSDNPVVAELQSLRTELANLSARVFAIEAKLEERQERVSGRSPGVASPVTVNYSFTSSQVPEIPPFPTTATSSAGASAAGSPGATSGYPLSRSPVGEQTEQFRLQVAQEAGEFLQRSLRGDNRGTSGRDRLRLPSRIYILIRDFDLNTYNPVRVFHSFSSIQPLVKRGWDCGGSIFIGFPSKWEAKECVRSAGLNWPEHDRT